MALAVKRADVIAEAAVRMGVAEVTAAADETVAAKVAAVTAEHEAKLAAKVAAKHDPIASADRFALAAVADADRGLEWLMAYAQRLATVAVDWHQAKRKEAADAKAKATEKETVAQ
jgi:hypothetical protein